VVGFVPVIADGLYTREQAERGRTVYEAHCAECHGSKLEGGTSAPLTGAAFIASWGKAALTLDDLYYIVRKTMPKDAAGSLARESYTDVVAYLLQQNGFPAGDKELTPDPEIMKTVRFGTATPAASPLPPK
jgi:quinoprotein glucose dehydrogenase